MMDEYVSWNDHKITDENKIAKKIVLQNCANQFLNKDSLKTVYFLLVHFYLNDGNVTLVRMNAMKLKRVYLKQKDAVHTLFKKLTLSIPVLKIIKYVKEKIFNPIFFLSKAKLIAFENENETDCF